MGVVTFNRAKRAQPPPMPRGDLLLESPPEVPPPAGGRNFGAILRMLPMLAGAGAMAMMMMSGGGRGGGGALGGVMGGMYGIAMLGMMLSQTGRGNDDQAQQLDAARRDYFRYLGQTRRKVRATAEAQRKAVTWRHPDPHDLWSLAGHRRMWERRTDSDDFASVRVAVGPQQFAQRITPPESKPIEDLEPLTTGALRRFIRTHRTVPSIPLALSLKGFSHVRLVGDVDAERRLAYAMLAQVVAWHAPTDVRVVVCAGPEVADRWTWTKWLPHLQHPTRTDGVGETRMFATDATQLAQVTDGLTSHGDSPAAQIVLIVDGVPGVSGASWASPTTHVTTIEVSRQRERPRRVEAGVAVLETHPEAVTLHRRQQSGQVASTPLGKPDQLPMVHAEMLARGLAPYRMPAIQSDDDETESEEVVFEPPKDYPAQVGVGDPLTIDVRQAWKLRPVHNRLRVPIGNGEDGRPVELDIKEAALGGWGPHGLCIGATGSGKSEFLRTHVLGLAMTHAPDQLNFVLVDFKGGATFLGLDELPHVSAVITNLEGELTLVDRMQDAIEGELARRQEVLASSGNYKNREDYDEARREGADLTPMPSLFIVVDEFSEMLSARPEFLDTFMMIGRVGRSLGVHQLLATQRLEESKLRGLDTYLSYRIGLRTFSPAESRIVLGVPDAYELPSAPGNGYLKYEQSMVRFKAAYVSGPWRGSTPEAGGRSTFGEPGVITERAWVAPVLEFVPEFVAAVTPPEPEPEPVRAEPAATRPEPEPTDEDEQEETLLDIVVDRLRGKGWPAHQVWLPPLDDPPTMDQLIGGELQVVPGRGLTVANPRVHGTLHAPVALVDRPRQQRRDPMWVDVSGAGGNVAIVGGPQSGKSMGVRALIAGMALTHTPAEVGFYCLDFGGGALGSLRDLAHVGSVCTRLDVDKVRRTVAEITSLLQNREIAFGEQGIDGMPTYRRGRRDGTIPADRFATDVFLVVDGWLTLRQEFEELEAQLTNLAARGLGFGIHVVATSNKWSEFRIGIRDLLQSRIELKLGDAFESEINRKLAALVPTGRPGRGLSPEGLHMLIGLPRIDSVESIDDIADGVKHFVAAVNGAWQGPHAAPVRLLPDSLPFTDLPVVTWDGKDRRFPWAIDELELAPVWLSPTTEPHFVIYGAPECGKSTVLRTMLAGIVARYTPAEARIALLDYRRSLLGAVPDEHLIGYAASQTAATDLMKNCADAVRSRLPGPDVTQQQLRDRSWWKGMDLFVVVDDYELVATSMGNAMQPFYDLVSQAGDIGLHIIVARGMGGAGRAAYSDQILARMRDGANPGLIMSGTREEGALLGSVKPSPLPPGRGTLVTRAGSVLVQAANLPPKE